MWSSLEILKTQNNCPTVRQVSNVKTKPSSWPPQITWSEKSIYGGNECLHAYYKKGSMLMWELKNAVWLQIGNKNKNGSHCVFHNVFKNMGLYLI